MKALLISPAFPPMQAGEADYTLHLAELLRDRKIEVEVLTQHRDGLPDVPGVTVSAAMRSWTWSDMPRLARRARASRPDVVLVLYLGWLYGRHPMVNYLPTLLRKVLPAAPVVTLFFNTAGASESMASLTSLAVHQWMRTVTAPRNSGFEHGNLIADSDRLIVFSEAHRAALAAKHPSARAKTDLVPAFPLLRCTAESTATRATGRERLGVGEDEFLFAYFGYLYPGKGVDTLIQAFKKVVAAGRPVRLALIGGSIDTQYSEWATYADCLRHLAWALGVDGRVVWAGSYAWNSDEPSYYLHGADACVLPFDVGLALNNTSAAAAAWHGLPILSTRGAQLEPAFVPETNCLLSPPRDADALAKQMLRVLEDRALAARLREGSRALAREVFSAEKAADKVEAILNQARMYARKGAPGEEVVPSP